VGGGLGFILTYLVIMVPAFLILLVVIIFSLRREGRVVAEFLFPDFQRGVESKLQVLCPFRQLRSGHGHQRERRLDGDAASGQVSGRTSGAERGRRASDGGRLGGCAGGCTGTASSKGEVEDQGEGRSQEEQGEGRSQEEQGATSAQRERRRQTLREKDTPLTDTQRCGCERLPRRH